MARSTRLCSWNKCSGTYPNYGYTDWRLPNRKELHSLTDYAEANLALPSEQPFTDVQAFKYWSSTTCAGDPAYAWIISMDSGSSISDSKYGQFGYMWPVRGGQVEPTGCTTWNDVISKYNDYVGSSASWNDVITCYDQYVTP